MIPVNTTLGILEIATTLEPLKANMVYYILRCLWIGRGSFLKNPYLFLTSQILLLKITLNCSTKMV